MRPFVGCRRRGARRVHRRGARGHRSGFARRRHRARCNLTKTSQHLLERHRAIEQSKPYQQCLEHELWLTALSQPCLDFGHRLQRTEQIAGAPLRCGLRKPLVDGRRNRTGIAAQHDGQLRPHQIGKTGQQQHQIHAQVREPFDGPENIGRAPFADDRKQRQQLVFRYEAEGIADAS